MTEQLYRDIYLLISEQISKAEDSIRQWIDEIEDDVNHGNEIDKHILEIIARDNKRLRKYSQMLNDFESEVAEPTKEGAQNEIIRIYQS